MRGLLVVLRNIGVTAGFMGIGGFIFVDHTAGPLIGGLAGFGIAFVCEQIHKAVYPNTPVPKAKQILPITEPLFRKVADRLQGNAQIRQTVETNLRDYCIGVITREQFEAPFVAVKMPRSEIDTLVAEADRLKAQFQAQAGTPP